MLELGLVMGILFIMIGYNFFLYLSLRDNSYLYYSLFAFNLLLYRICTSGLGDRYLWSLHPETWHFMMRWVSGTLVVWFMLQFTRSFLHTAETAPRLDRLLWYVGLSLGGILVAPMLPLSLNLIQNIIVPLITIFAFGLVLVTAIIVWWHNYRSARYFLLAWSFFILTVILFLLQTLAILPTILFATDLVYIGSVVLVLMLSLALADRINLLQADTAQANQDLHESENQLLHYQHHLEQLVAARTEELNRVNAELDRLAHVDGLTHIANRRRFDQYLAEAWQSMAQAQLPLSLILCDIDYFKLYNDSYGHQAGDDCLRQVAQAFTTAIKRSTDLAARYGGEEFVFVLPRTDEVGVKIVAGYLHERIQQLQIPHAASKCNQYITISLGVSTIIPTLNQSPDDLVTAADSALYQAKLQGRNCTVSQRVGE